MQIFFFINNIYFELVDSKEISNSLCWFNLRNEERQQFILTSDSPKSLV